MENLLIELLIIVCKYTWWYLFRNEVLKYNWHKKLVVLMWKQKLRRCFILSWNWSSELAVFIWANMVAEGSSSLFFEIPYIFMKWAYLSLKLFVVIWRWILGNAGKVVQNLNGWVKRMKEIRGKDIFISISRYVYIRNESTQFIK
jgi:hypothetical protein